MFLPYSIHDHQAYASKVRSRLELMGVGLDSVHDAADGPVHAVERAKAIFIGCGNTFRLIDALWRHDLIEPIRRRVTAGMPYLGTSAGANVARPSIRTTNDMPIVQPPSFSALGLVPFQINRTIRTRFPDRRMWARRVSNGSPNSTKKTNRRTTMPAAFPARPIVANPFS